MSWVLNPLLELYWVDMSHPKLRFKEYKNSWTQHSIGRMGEVITGSTPDTSKAEFYENGTYPFVSPGDINDARYINGTKKLVTNLGAQKGRLIKANSILFVSIGSTIGKVAQNKVDCLTNQQINTLTTNKYFDPFFVYSALEKQASKIRLLAGTHAVPIINKTSFSKVKLYAPEIEEQNKIGAFLALIDEKIAILINEIECLKKYKKGVMQKIFSQEIRFKNLNGKNFPAWSYVAAGEIFKSVSNRNHNSELPILSATQEKGMIPRSENGIDIISSEKSISSYKVINKGDFVISLRSFQGGIEYSEYEGISSPAYTVFKPARNIDDDFFRFYFKKDSFISELNGTVVGIRDGKQITYSAFSTLKLPYPCIEEQKVISTFLTAVSMKIELAKKSLELLKKYKHGLLQDMFI